jgi:hypothetical protein
MYLHKKVLVIPMNNQYEQLCNAKALKLMGCTVVQEISPNFTNILKQWIEYGSPLKVNYYDQLDQIVGNIILKQDQILRFAY